MKIARSLLFVILGLSPLAAKQDRPNVLVFLIDDLGWADLGSQGSQFYETPHIDKLAASGVRLLNSYSANPVCSPTRAALMTGKAPQRVGITQWIPQPSKVHLPEGELTVAETFQAAGYRTGYIGKWHLGEKANQLPTSHGFDWMKAVNRAGQPASYFYPYQRKSKRGNYWDVPDLDAGQQGDYLTDAMTDHALEFLKDNREKPFFLYFAHYAVHTPIQAPADLIKKYEAKVSKMYGESKAAGIPERDNTISRSRQDHAVYAAMLENLDANVGRVLERLEDLQLTENTIIVFTSDNGGHCHLPKAPGVTSNLPLRSGKGWTYEGGIRIPTLISWKEKIRPQVSTTPMISMDLYPTLLELTGQELLPHQHLDGRSLASVLLTGASETLEQRSLCWTYPHQHGSGHRPSHAIRKGEWKMIHFESDQSRELYDLKKDPGERHNLALQEPQKVKELWQELQDWIEKTTPFASE